MPEDSFGFRGNNSAFSLSEDSFFVVDKAVCKKIFKFTMNKITRWIIIITSLT